MKILFYHRKMGEKFHAAHRKIRRIQRVFCGIPQFIFKNIIYVKLKSLNYNENLSNIQLWQNEKIYVRKLTRKNSARTETDYECSQYDFIKPQKALYFT